MWRSSATPPFPSLSLLLLPRCGVFSLLAGGLLAPGPRHLSPLLAAPAGQHRDEEEDHHGDAAADSQHQQEEVGEGGWRARQGHLRRIGTKKSWGGASQTCGDHAETYLSARAVNVRRVLDLADEGAVIGELDPLNDDGGVAAHHVAGPEDTLPENAINGGVRPLLVVEDLKKKVDGDRAGL